ncbi:flagellar motor protein MotB [Solidesulfovibrio sp.]|uniref:OmpA/MotB family protein n=1 Tax=Solidesulfovibrio sp. TaxID=2910990 RepID=UPI002619388E|nr:flagellar motor protein MotB [Solidesulfovibrio sp.]
MAKNNDHGKTIVVYRESDEGHGGHHGGSWKVAYADFVTALMAFFLLLWLVVSLKPQKKQELSLVFQDKNVPSKEKVQNLEKVPTFISPDAVKGNPEFKLSQENKLKYEIALLVKELITSDLSVKSNSGVSNDSSGVMMQVNNSVMFKPGSAELTPTAVTMLDGVAKILRDFKINLTVRGHADDEEKGGPYPSKWELSAARAAAATRYLAEKAGIATTRLRAVGLADSQPLVPPTSAENKARNRRIEFFYTSPDMRPTERSQDGP